MKLDDAELLESSERKAGGGVRDGRIQSSREPQGPLSLEGRLVRYLLSSLGDPPLRFTLWNGESATGGEGRALGSLRIADRASLLKLLINPNLYFGDTYSDGSIEIEGDLAAVIESLELNCADYAQDRVMQPIHGFRTGIIGETPVETRYPEAASFGILRREFDDYLLRRSQARLKLGEPLRTMVRDGGGWLVNGEIRTPLVVGAGGHFCPVSRALGTQLGHSETIVSAQEIEFPLSPDERSECRVDSDVVQLYFCADLKGYGWCFRKGNYLNIGLGREDNHRLADHVEKFCEGLQQQGSIPRNLPGKFKGHAYLSYPASRRKLADDGVLVIGDAAGLAYPQSGEGIRPAVESALIAAQVIAGAAGDYRQRQIEPYIARLTGRFGKRDPRPPGAPWLPQEFRNKLAKRLMASAWFARHVVIDNWFLHTGRRTALTRRSL